MLTSRGVPPEQCQSKKGNISTAFVRLAVLDSVCMIYMVMGDPSKALQKLAKPGL